MLSIEDLKRVVILSYLNDELLEKLLPAIDFLRFEERDSVFLEGDIADRFYMLRRGKILLEKRTSDKITVSVGTGRKEYRVA